MTFREHYESIKMMYDYFRMNTMVNSQMEIVMKIADRFGVEIGSSTFHRMKDDMCYVFRCKCRYDKHTKCYKITKL